MLSRLVCALLGALALLAGAGPARSEAPPRVRSITQQVWVDPIQDLAPEAAAAPLISNILYVNRCRGGCVITPGQNDARLNTSSVVDHTVNISEFGMGDEAYDQVIDCLRDVYSPYNVQIVTEDPGDDVFHHEAILAGTPQELGLDPNVGGIAPTNCVPLNNVISFSFGNFPDATVEELCWTVAQESAHSFGLPNHVYNCLDPMTYLAGPCGRKYFRNRAFQCGDFQPKTCICGVSAQNSHLELMNTFGEGTPPAPPTVELLYPTPDTTVGDHFSIFFTALDPRLVDHADVYLNGTRYVRIPGLDFSNQEKTYDAEAPDFPDGYIDVEIRAYNDINGEAGTATATVLKGEPCTTAGDCFEHMECSDGRCSYPAPVGELGDECDYDQYCLSGSCPDRGGEGHCTQTCNPNVSGACPSGYDCLADGFCWPADAGGGGGCDAVRGGVGDERFPLATSALFAAAVLLFRRRARSRGKQ